MVKCAATNTVANGPLGRRVVKSRGTTLELSLRNLNRMSFSDCIYLREYTSGAKGFQSFFAEAFG